MCLCRWQRDRRDALTWQGAERSPCRQGATRAAQGPDPGLCLPSPQVRPHVTDFADPLGRTRVGKNPRRCAASAESEMNSGQPTNDLIGKTDEAMLDGNAVAACSRRSSWSRRPPRSRPARAAARPRRWGDPRLPGRRVRPPLPGLRQCHGDARPGRRTSVDGLPGHPDAADPRRRVLSSLPCIRAAARGETRPGTRGPRRRHRGGPAWTAVVRRGHHNGP
jgi:hypothetical protein